MVIQNFSVFFLSDILRIEKRKKIIILELGIEKKKEFRKFEKIKEERILEIWKIKKW